MTRQQGRYSRLRIEGAILMLERKKRDHECRVIDHFALERDEPHPDLGKTYYGPGWSESDQQMLDVLSSELEDMRRDGREDYLFDLAEGFWPMEVRCMTCEGDLGTKPTPRKELAGATTHGLCHRCAHPDDAAEVIDLTDYLR